MSGRLIVNADDFGASAGVNRGIVDCHARGVLTSASLMVTGRAAREAAALAREHPALGIGLHWDCWGEDERAFAMSDERAVREEFERQLDAFHALVGRDPTHVDTHRHAHRECFALFAELVEPLGVPLRGDGRVDWIGGFYAQWEWMVTDLEHVGVAALERILADEVGGGWTEVSCHPGYVTADYDAVYLAEREAEVRTLCDPRIRAAVDALDLRLVSYADLPVAA